MSTTELTVHRDPAGGRPRVEIRSTGPRGRGHVGIRVLSASPGRVRVALVAEGALLVAGDDVAVGLRVGPGMSLDVVEPAGTVAYDMRGGSARWRLSVLVEEAGRVAWRGQPFVVSGGAEVDREVTVQLHGGVAVLRDVLVLGRVGEAGGVVRQRFRGCAGDRSVLVEDLVLDGTMPAVGVLGANRVVDAVTVLGERATGIPTPGTAARLDLESEGTVWRYLGDTVHGSPLDAVWSGVAGRVAVPA